MNIELVDEVKPVLIIKSLIYYIYIYKKKI